MLRHDFRIFPSSGFLRSVRWCVTDALGQPIGPIVRGKAVKDGTYR